MAAFLSRRPDQASATRHTTSTLFTPRARSVSREGSYYALARLGLARAFAAAGEMARSRTAYQDFLALWKDAAPDLPVLLQARAEYARLS